MSACDRQRSPATVDGHPLTDAEVSVAEVPVAAAQAAGPKRPLLVFYNLNLTASRDVALMVRRACGTDRFVNLDSHATYQEQRPFNRAFFHALLAKEPGLEGVSAHRIVPDIHLAADLNVFPIVFLRHPLLHALATYEAARNRKNDWPGKEIVASLDVAGWIEWCLQPEQKSGCKNFQSCLLSLDDDGRVLPPRGKLGIHDTPGFHGRLAELGADDKAKLSLRRGRLLLVQERLDAMPMVGVAEAMQKSLFLLSREAASKGIALAGSKGAGQESTTGWRHTLRAAERSLPPETLDRFYDANEDDLILWERYFAKLTWTEPVSHLTGGKGRDEAGVAGVGKRGRRKKSRPAETIPGLDEQL